MKRPTPRVSVCIPTHPGAATIGTAIDSVLAQSLADFKLIVIDVESPDDTHAIVECFTDARLIYHRSERLLGPLGDWNHCREQARGTHCKLLPHDDLLQEDCLERQVAVLGADREQRIALVFAARKVLGPDGRVLAHHDNPGGQEGPIAGRPAMRAGVRRGTNPLGEPGAALFRKSHAETTGAFDASPSYVIDLDYGVRLLAHGDVYCGDEPLANFRVSKESWSVAIGSGQSCYFRYFVTRFAKPSEFLATTFDRFCGRFTPSLNNLARMLFCRLYLR